ncbi:MAG: tetratricopeptide repeat protein [Candidatus Neomarinimicrobiota bacterium]
MSKKFLVILFVMLSISTLFANDLEREMIFKSGISAFVAEDYDKSIDIFQELISQGKVSWELYYNLANAYYRQGELGNAIRYWEKAKILAPGQEDIIYNLEIAEKRLIDKVILPDVFPLFKWYRSLRSRVNIADLVFYIGLILFVSLLLLAFIRYRLKAGSKKKSRLAWTIRSIALLLILSFSALALDAYTTRKDQNYAIILENTVNIYSEPDEDSKILFVLHEGSKVKLNKNIENTWMYISYFDDKLGWIKSETLGEI